jgi:hypothetical protein
MRRHPIASVVIDDQPMDVSVSVDFDGVEYVGRLWFDTQDARIGTVTDRGALPGRSEEAAIARARALGADDLVNRYRRGLSERRRYRPLRRVTADIIDGIRKLNRIGAAMRTGDMDADAAARQMTEIEAELHGLVTRLRDVAGDDDPEL